MTLLEILSDNREQVIKSYNNSHKGISLKEYMDIVVWFFKKAHTGMAKEMIKAYENDSLIWARVSAGNYIKKALVVANRKANASYNKEMEKLINGFII